MIAVNVRVCARARARVRIRAREHAVYVCAYAFMCVQSYLVHARRAAAISANENTIPRRLISTHLEENRIRCSNPTRLLPF